MIQSMTAFARTTGQNDSITATWEIRIVNHRYFDCSFKLPEKLRHLELPLRQKLQHALQRGKVECLLKISTLPDTSQNFVLNEQLIEKLMVAVNNIKNYTPTTNLNPLQILSWPQVLQTTELDLESSQPLLDTLFSQLLEETTVTRGREGNLLAQLIKDRLEQILAMVTNLKNLVSQITAKQRAKLEKHLGEIAINFDQSRLEQEMVYFIQKIDVTEELDRLAVHTQEALRILNQGGVMGKKLDFLMQELHREANTLAAKSNDLEVTQITVDLKVLIEQMREQIQNIV